MLCKDAGVASFELDVDGSIVKFTFPAPAPVITPVAMPEWVPPSQRGKVENDPGTGTKKNMFERALGRPMPTLTSPPGLLNGILPEPQS